MIWRLMASILVMSDTGSVSLVTSHTDWPDEMTCRQILQSHYTAPPEREFNGHRVTVKISASCVPVGVSEQVAMPQLPPPIANMIPRMLAPPCGGRLPCNYN